MITKLFQALSKTRKGIAGAFNTLLNQRVTPETLEMLEETLITADLGIYTTCLLYTSPSPRDRG